MPFSRQQIPFIPYSAEREWNLVRCDDELFSRTKKYLSPLILQTLDHQQISTYNRLWLSVQLTQDVEMAAEQFLKHHYLSKPTYKFSTYFTWYIAERLAERSRHPSGSSA